MHPAPRTDDMEERRFTWQRAGVIIAALALVGMVIGLVRHWSDAEREPTAATSATVQTSTHGSTTTDTTASAPPPDSPCRTIEGRPVACVEASAWLLAAVPRCDDATVAGHLRVDPALRTLNLQVKSAGTLCLVRPGALASAAGVTTEALAHLDPDKAGALTECHGVGGQTPTACTKAHRVEFIGIWVAGDTLTKSGACDALAATYAQRRFDDPSDRVQIQRFDATNNTKRCALVSSIDLYDSLWHIGKDPLPTAPRS